ncbi:SAM-dependent methyltransferase [Methanocaldococcus indicus]|uniref:SAM-dependent methyltransferase n=1 Tax=Methanocaldococcus indicus TaxID=213231 RepID=UPI003C6D9AC9
MKLLALITTKPGYERELKDELKKLNFYVRYTPFRGLLKLYGDKLDNLESKYICRLIPIEKESSLNSLIDDTINLIKERNLSGSFVVRCWRRGKHNFSSEYIERILGKEISNFFGYKVSLKNYDFKIDVHIIQNEVYLSLNEIKFEDNIKNLTKKYNERFISRAEKKLLEVLEKFPYVFKDLNVVLDIGSSPGGWAKVLSNLSNKVYAIDPGELKIKKDNIIHIKKRAEYVNLNDKLDLITNDTNLYPEESINLTLKFLDNLKKNKYIVQTIKYENKYSKKEELNKIIKILEDNNLELVKIAKLKANTKNEHTLIIRRL